MVVFMAEPKRVFVTEPKLVVRDGAKGCDGAEVDGIVGAEVGVAGASTKRALVPSRTRSFWLRHEQQALAPSRNTT